jgi:hypothetical protein
MYTIPGQTTPRRSTQRRPSSTGSVDDQRGLPSTLTLGIRADLTKVCIFGHAKGKLIALVAVDGMGVGNRASKRHHLLDSLSRGTGPLRRLVQRGEDGILFHGTATALAWNVTECYFQVTVRYFGDILRDDDLSIVFFFFLKTVFFDLTIGFDLTITMDPTWYFLILSHLTFSANT